MATLTIRNIPEEVKQALRERAAAHGRSLEQEVRMLLTDSATLEDNAADMLADGLLEYIRSAPKGDPVDPRYRDLSQKEMSDLVSEGLL